MGDAHAPLAPSGAYQWAPEDGCLGAVAMQAQYSEDAESEKARWGTAWHHYGSETLLGRTVAIGDEAPNGVPIDKEMVDTGDVYVKHVRETIRPDLLLVEKRVHATSVHPTNCWGTTDAGSVDMTAREVNVVDGKGGHRYVDVYRNYQLILYAIGLLDTAHVPQSDWKHWSIRLAIVQPRNYHPSGPVRTWTIGGPALLKYVEPLRRRAAAALRPNAPLTTGDHCRDCTARHACPALLQSAALSVDVAHEQTPMELSPRAIGLELRYLSDAEARIKARKDALYEQALALSRAGTDVPLWRADYSDGREVWDRPASQIVMLGEMWGVDVRKPTDVITPVQAVKAGLPRAALRGLTMQPRGSMRLVPVTDDTVSRAFE